MSAADKPRFRVKAASVARPASHGGMPMSAFTGGYLRDTRSAVVSTRPAPLLESREAIRRSWRRVAGLAQDIVLNSGRLSGAITQVISDTLGSELQLNPKPDVNVLKRLGYDDKEIQDLIALIKAEWKHWAWSPRECDFRGKFTVPQLMEVALRNQLIFGEVTGFMDFMPAAQRSRYGIASGTKVCLKPPSHLVQDTIELRRLYQGVLHDANWRPTAYRFRVDDGIFVADTRDIPAFDRLGNPRAIHVFEPQDARDVRGISPIAAAIRKHIQHEMLEDATLQMALLQTVLGLTLTSDAPSQDAFEALQALKEADSAKAGQQLAEQFLGMYSAQVVRAQESAIHFGSDPKISHLAPGEKFDVHSVETPGPSYEPFEKSLSRDTARAIGVTYESFTLDNRHATYSSSRIGIASIWPVVVRRRERVAGPVGDIIYANFMDEMVFTGRIPLKGGYAAFRANRDRLLWTQWRGPAKPSADDKKSAEASARRLETYSTTVEIEAAELGHDVDELQARQHAEHEWYTSRGMRSPYEARASQPAPTAGNDDDDERRGEAA